MTLTSATSVAHEVAKSIESRAATHGALVLRNSQARLESVRLANGRIVLERTIRLKGRFFLTRQGIGAQKRHLIFFRLIEHVGHQRYDAELSSESLIAMSQRLDRLIGEDAAQH